MAEVLKKRTIPYPLKKDREWVVLDTIMVKENYRSKGIGKICFLVLF